MKALVQRSYGPPEDMTIEDLPIPEPGRGQVLIRMRACGLNASDYEFKTGSPHWPSPSLRA